MKQIVHINQHHIKYNRKVCADERKPVITCKTYKTNEYHHSIDLICSQTGKVLGSVMYSPDKPLSCGANVWLEFDTEVIEIKPKEE
jgi:hypothetical protein